MRLDRFISSRLGVNRGDVRLMLARGRILVDGCVAVDVHQLVDDFSQVVLDGELLQENIACYVMMNKPIGVVSATKDELHATVIDLLAGGSSGIDNIRAGLHIAGRLDLNSSGLLLLTNDGKWSKGLSSPENNIVKLYRVTLENPLTEEYVSAFFNGMYFSYEDITTKPVKLEIISDYVAEVSLLEGRYHQIKRMFGRFRNPVLALHRIAIGELQLDLALAPGQSRMLTRKEVGLFFTQPQHYE